ncbi:unnamed protein product [Prunus armeniaca]
MSLEHLCLDENLPSTVRVPKPRQYVFDSFDYPVPSILPHLYVTSQDQLRRSTILSALGLPSLPSRFCFWELTSNFPVGHPSWDCSSPNSLNFGVPMTQKPMSSQKTSC